MGSDELTSRYGTDAPEVACTSFDYSNDNSPNNKQANVDFYVGMQAALSDHTYKWGSVDLNAGKIQTAIRGVYTDNLLFDVSKEASSSGHYYMHNYAIKEKQRSVFTIGAESDKFGANGTVIDAIALNSTNFDAASVNLQTTNGHENPHTLYAPEFESNYLDNLWWPTTIGSPGYENTAL